MSAIFGYTIFYVPDVGATLDFYTEAFGIAARFVTPENDYGELETGATALAFASNSLAASNLGASGGFTQLDATRAPVGASITLLTDDVASRVLKNVGMEIGGQARHSQDDESATPRGGMKDSGTQ